MLEDIIFGHAQDIIDFVRSLPWYSIILFAMFITFLENVFPPSPSDTLLIFCGSLISLGVVDYTSLLISSTVGSTAGFLMMFFLGRKYGVDAIESKKFKFISEKKIYKAQKWFRRYGYSIIFINRFLSGTRAVISFVAGISKMKISKTWFLAAGGALLWNSLLIWLGMFFGENWHLADKYISRYGYVIFALIIIAAVIYFIYRRKKKKSRQQSNLPESQDR